MATTREESSNQPQSRVRMKRRKRRRPCGFCVDHVTVIDYKNVNRLRRYVSDRGKIQPRRNTGTCNKHQRLVATAIKQARFIGLLPYCID